MRHGELFSDWFLGIVDFSGIIKFWKKNFRQNISERKEHLDNEKKLLLYLNSFVLKFQLVPRLSNRSKTISHQKLFL